MAQRVSEPLQLSVINDGGRWVMVFRGRRLAFADRQSALREAVRQAHQCSKDGTPTQVVCVDDAQGPKVVWTSGHDPEPASVALARRNGDGKPHNVQKGRRRRTPA